MKEIKSIKTRNYRSNVLVYIELPDKDPVTGSYCRGIDIPICADDIGVEWYSSPEEWAEEKVKELKDELEKDGYTMDEFRELDYKTSLVISVDHLIGWGKELENDG